MISRYVKSLYKINKYCINRYYIYVKSLYKINKYCINRYYIYVKSLYIKLFFKYTFTSINYNKLFFRCVKY